jgi:hypothetical protein
MPTHLGTNEQRVIWKVIKECGEKCSKEKAMKRKSAMRNKHVMRSENLMRKL